MSILLITQLVAMGALSCCLLGLGLVARRTRSRPTVQDQAVAKGSLQHGIAYAFTLGLAPWAKESTRLHWVAYLRGILFHVGIFAGLAAFLISPLWTSTPVVFRWLAALVTGIGAIMGVGGILMRLVDRHLRTLSNPDDHFSVALVTLFLASMSAALVKSGWMPVMYIASTLMFLYIPLGKIRHCIYFALSRRFYGMFIGRRGVIHEVLR